MKAFLRKNLAYIGIGVSALLAASAGLFAAVAFSASSATAPTKTVTINVSASGATGPAGPKGPSGAAGPTGPAGAGGADSCPEGSTFGEVKFVVQGEGPTSVLACIVD